LLPHFIKGMKILHLRCKGRPYQWMRFPNDSSILQAILRVFLNDGILVTDEHPIPVRAYASPYTELTKRECRMMCERMNEFLVKWIRMTENRMCRREYLAVFVPGFEGGKAIHDFIISTPRDLDTTSK
jgi:hypothetical protein